MKSDDKKALILMVVVTTIFLGSVFLYGGYLDRKLQADLRLQNTKDLLARTEADIERIKKHRENNEEVTNIFLKGTLDRSDRFEARMRCQSGKSAAESNLMSAQSRARNAEANLQAARNGGASWQVSSAQSALAQARSDVASARNAMTPFLTC